MSQIRKFFALKPTLAGASQVLPTARQKQKRPHMATVSFGNSGRGERIRTSGLYVPNVALYQAKLHPDGKTQWIAANKTHALRSKE